MTTAADIINEALSEIGVKAIGQTLDNVYLTNGLSVLNRMIDSLSNENLMIYSETEESFDLVAGQSSYSIGAGGNFNTVRPESIQTGCFHRLDGGVQDDPVGIIPLEQYRLIRDKTATGTPYQLAYNPTFPTGTIYLYYTPSSSTQNLHLRSLKKVTSFATTATTVTLPPGYEQMLITNLAIKLSPRYGKEISMLLANNAIEAKDVLIKRNQKFEPVRLEVANLNKRKLR